MKLSWIESITFLVWSLYGATARVQASCHIQFLSDGKSVEKLVVEYGKDVNISCHAQGHKMMKWTISQSHKFTGSTWTEKALTDWNVKPVCRATFEGRDPCEKELHVTLFKIPKNLSISFHNDSGPVVKNRNYTLLCEVPNFAPVENLVVSWHKKGLNDSLRTVTFQNNTNMTPQNVSSTITINATIFENGAQYWCEAKLKVGEEKPKLVQSKTIDVIVNYAPVITLPNVSDVPVFRDYQEVLVCEADGNPKPEIIWSFNNKSSKGGSLNISMEMVGEITCKATNEHGTTTKTVQLVFKEDYLPLIAGFVAVVVVIISAIFVFIYSIYYTNTKMGHYSLKDAKPNPQNGDVAQNGLDSNLPVKKLSQQNIYVLGAMP